MFLVLSVVKKKPKDGGFAARRTKDSGRWWYYGRDGMLLSFDRQSRSKDWTSVRMQLRPDDPLHRRHFQRLVAEAPSVLAEDPYWPDAVGITRLDFALDYRISPDWLFVHRPRAVKGMRIESEEDGFTVYFGTGRGRSNMVRVYNGAVRHPDDYLTKRGTWTRFESEVSFKARVPFSKLADALYQRDPFPKVWASVLHIEDLNAEQIGHVLVVRALGALYVRNALGSRSRAWARIRATLNAVRDGTRRLPLPGSLTDDERRTLWASVAEQTRHLLLEDPKRDGVDSPGGP